jgi:tRNA nucleotidyltransferase (CCA-adding enzyme)
VENHRRPGESDAQALVTLLGTSDVVVIVDPVNPENNVASRIGKADLVEIQAATE